MSEPACLCTAGLRVWLGPRCRQLCRPSCSAFGVVCVLCARLELPGPFLTTDVWPPTVPCCPFCQLRRGAAPASLASGSPGSSLHGPGDSEHGTGSPGGSGHRAGGYKYNDASVRAGKRAEGT